MLAAPVLPFGLAQEPSHAEWWNPYKPDGSLYKRKAHKGWDFQAQDRRCLAVALGTIRPADFGSDLGEHQFVIVDEWGGGWFYAHTATRLPNGTKVKAGDFVATMGDEGVPGAVHLHLEYLSTWYDWFSSVDRTDPLHEIWEELNMALSDEDKTWITQQIRGATQAVVRALTVGENDPADPEKPNWLPDDAGWKARLANNIRSVKETMSAGVDPETLVEIVKQAAREGTG